MIDFSSYILERTENFTGREWVLQRINYWLGEAPDQRIFLLVGGPGTGKSAIAARLAQLSSGLASNAAAPLLSRGWLTYSHFCQAGLESTLSPLTFVQSLSETLANRYPAFRESLEKGASRQIVISQQVENVQPGGQVIGAQINQVSIEIRGADARPLFDQAVRIPLRHLCNELPEERIIILVDSLDEALTFNQETNITQLLKLVNDFPRQVRFLLTCRSNSERVFNLVGEPTLDLIADAPRGLDEVELYAALLLRDLPEETRTVLANRIARRSGGNFLYAFHVLNDLVPRGGSIGDPNTLELPEELEDVYRKFIAREMAANPAKWKDEYRPLLGAIAVARGEGLTKAQLVGITGLAEDTASDVLNVSAQYLVGGELETNPHRIYHQSFRDFLLEDETYSIYPAERHEAIAGYFQRKYGANWASCNDEYALRYTPVHWAEAATLSNAKRDQRSKELITIASNKRYQQSFEKRLSDLPTLHEYLQRAVFVSSLNDGYDMLPWLLKAAREFGAFRQNFLRGESVVMLAEEGEIDQAEGRLGLFSDVGEDWQVAARLIIAWLGIDKNRSASERLRSEAAQNLRQIEPLPLLLDRLDASLNGESGFPCSEGESLPLEVGQQLVRRVSGQQFDQEMIASVNPSLIAKLRSQSHMLSQAGYAANFDGPILVNIARESPAQGTELVDQYIDAHAGYNYVEYRNRSLWMVLHAVLQNHPEQDWVKLRLRRLLVAALSGGGVDFTEMLPVTAAMLSEMERANSAQQALDRLRDTVLSRSLSIEPAPQPQTERYYPQSPPPGLDDRTISLTPVLHHIAPQGRQRANDSWGTHKRRMTALMELYKLLFDNAKETASMFDRALALPDGFAGFQAPAMLRLADAMRACRFGSLHTIQTQLDAALRFAHRIQDYHFSARVTARCNALSRWHLKELNGPKLADTIKRIVSSPADPEFGADHVVNEAYLYRGIDGDTLPIDAARDAETLEQLVEVFQRPAVEFRRLNPQFGLSEKLTSKTAIRIPDPGLPPLLAVHLAARVLADDDLEADRTALIRSLVPIAASNPTALDTVLSYLMIAAQPAESSLLKEIVEQAGPVAFSDTAAPDAQIGPDACIPA